MRIPRSNAGSFRNASYQITNDTSSLATNLASSSLDIVQRYTEEKDNSDIQEAQNKRLKELNDWKAQNYSREGEKALGVTKDYETKVKELNENLTANLSPKARKKFENWSYSQDENERLRVMMFEQGEDQKVKKSRFSEGLNLSSELVRVNAKGYDDAFTHLEATLENAKNSGLIKEEDYETERVKYINQLRGEVGKNYYTQDKHDFMKKIDNMGFGEPEKEYYRQKYKHDLKAEEREKKTLYAEEARLIMDQRKDFQAQAIDKSDTSHYFTAATKLREMGYKDWSKDLEREGSLYQKTINFNEKYKSAPLIEKVKAAQELTVPDELEGSGLEFQSRKTIQAETNKELTRYSKDPAGYVSRFVQGQTPEQIASSRLTLQRQQGIVPEKGYKVLTFSEIDNYKKAFEAGDERQKADLINNLNQYGKYSSKAISELGVNRTLTLSPFIENKLDNELLISAATSKPSILDSGIKEEDINSNALDSDFVKNLKNVQSDFPTDSMLGEQISEIVTTMKNISIKKNDPDAGPKFFEKNFSVENDTDKNIFFPKKFDEDQVIDFLDNKKKTLIESINTKDQHRDKQAKWAVQGYTWVNSTGGFVLADKKTGRVVPGSQVFFTDIDKD